MTIETQHPEARVGILSETAEPPWRVVLLTGLSIISVLALVFGVIAWRDKSSTSVATNAETPNGAAAPVASVGPPQTVDIELGDLFVKPKSIDVATGTNVTLHVTNTGLLQHDLKLDDTKGTKLLAGGESADFNVGIVNQAMVLYCSVAGHRSAGMELAITPTGGSSSGPSGVAGPTGVGVAPAPARAIDFSAKPAAAWKPFDPMLAPAPGGSEHQLTLEATETNLEIAPGIRQEMWTFGGQVPGPILRGRVGDIFTVTLSNRGKVDHSIDFHASKVAWNDEMRSIKPGESLVYQFEAKHAGIFMYHCGTAPALHHIGNGMYGAIVIDPPNLPSVDHEFVLVQSELYVSPAADQPADLQPMLHDQWNAVVFNGYVNQYKSAPIRVEPNQRVRVWVLDAGPSENSSFHVVGTIFDTVFKEGNYLLTRDVATRGGAQALDLQPAQGGFVEFTFDEAGLYPIVTHKFSNVAKGALGLFQAGEVAATAGGGH